MVRTTLLCQLNNGCMGCCGRDFGAAESVSESIKKNSREFVENNPQTEKQLLQFRERRFSGDLRNGVCRNLIEKDGKIICPLHPAVQGGKDLREGHCNIYFLCKTAKVFRIWDKEKQEKFISFVDGKNLDNVAYSLMMDRGELLSEFEERLK